MSIYNDNRLSVMLDLALENLFFASKNMVGIEKISIAMNNKKRNLNL